MKKLKLNLDEIKVESFESSVIKKTQHGTVRAQNMTVYTYCGSCPEEIVCGFTDGPSCTPNRCTQETPC